MQATHNMQISHWVKIIGRRTSSVCNGGGRPPRKELLKELNTRYFQFNF